MWATARKRAMESLLLTVEAKVMTHFYVTADICGSSTYATLATATTLRELQKPQLNMYTSN